MNLTICSIKLHVYRLFLNFHQLNIEVVTDCLFSNNKIHVHTLRMCMYVLYLNCYQIKKDSVGCRKSVLILLLIIKRRKKNIINVNNQEKTTKSKVLTFWLD